jgi:cell division protein FtsL
MMTTERMRQRPFLALWTLAVLATVAAFVVHLGLRGKIVDLGYKLGRVRAEQARLREVKRALSLEAASYETPQRVENIARTLLGMTPPPPERIIPMRAPARIQDEPSEDEAANVGGVPGAASSAAPSAAPAAPAAPTGGTP